MKAAPWRETQAASDHELAIPLRAPYIALGGCTGRAARRRPGRERGLAPPGPARSDPRLGQRGLGLSVELPRHRRPGRGRGRLLGAGRPAPARPGSATSTARPASGPSPTAPTVRWNRTARRRAGHFAGAVGRAHPRPLDRHPAPAQAHRPADPHLGRSHSTGSSPARPIERTHRIGREVTTRDVHDSGSGHPGLAETGHLVMTDEVAFGRLLHRPGPPPSARAAPGRPGAAPHRPG